MYSHQGSADVEFRSQIAVGYGNPTGTNTATGPTATHPGHCEKASFLSLLA